MNAHEIKKAFGEMQIAVPINLHGLLPQRGMKINKVQILIGATALLLGSLVYLIDRSPDQTYFVYSTPISISLYNILPDLFGTIGNSLPAFIHVFSFSLITAGLLSCQKRGCLIVCLSWLFVDFAFELGQKYSALPLKIIPDWFDGIPFLENSVDYFRCGTFDVFDLVAIAFGAAAAFFVILKTSEKRRIV